MWDVVLTHNSLGKQMVDDSGHTMQGVRYSDGVHFVTFHTLRGEASRSNLQLTVCLPNTYQLSTAVLKLLCTFNGESTKQLTDNNVMTAAISVLSNSGAVHLQTNTRAH